MNKIIVITGQTATGKTKLALEYAQKINGELINCDSRQIYKYLDIITGKDYQLLSKVKIWLLDVVKPNEHFSSFDFVKLAIPVIKKILSKNKTPIIVGGTAFYLYHFLYNVASENIPPNWKLRKKFSSKSVKELQTIMRDLDPQSFNRLNNSEKHNPQRLTRRIEILQSPKKRDSKNQISLYRYNDIKKKLELSNLSLEFIGLKFKKRESLQKAIEKRVEERLKNGAIQEVKKLLKMGYGENDPGLKTIGYHQLLLHLKGAINKEEAINQWISKEIQYAKRQYTFMKKDPNISWKEI